MVAQGPIRGIQAALRYLGWMYEGPLVFKDERGIDYPTNEVTPAMMWKVVVRSERRSMEDGFDNELTERGLLPEGGAVN